MELLTYRLSDPNDKSKDLAKKITELVVASSVTDQRSHGRHPFVRRVS